jgi:hypothetical protein
MEYLVQNFYNLLKKLNNFHFIATDLKSKKPGVYDGEAKEGVKVDCTITLDDDDFVLLSQGINFVFNL